MAYVETGRLLNGYYVMMDARNEFQKQTASWDANLDTLKTDATTAIENYKKDSLNMGLEERKTAHEFIRTKQEQYYKYKQTIEEKIQQEDQRLTDEVIRKADAFLKKYAEERGFQIIFAVTGSGTIAYAEKSLDVTDEILEGLNQEYLDSNPGVKPPKPVEQDTVRIQE